MPKPGLRCAIAGHCPAARRQRDLRAPAAAESIMSAPLDRPLEPLVRKLAYWAEFDRADEQALLDLPHQIKTLERHDNIVRERERTARSCVLLSGFAFRHKIVAGGARQILSVHMKGDIVDLQNSFLGVAD